MSIYFSIEQTTWTLNGTPLSGFSEDTDAIEIPQLEIAAVKRGADGKMTASTTGNKGVPITFKFLPTSESVKFLSSIGEQQKKGARVVFNGSAVNHENGASLALSNGILTEMPPFPSLGKGETGNMNYVIEFETVEASFETADFS